MKKYTTVGLFSGAGGLDLGFENAGFKHLYSSDLDYTACQTLITNRPNWIVECENAENLSLAEMNADVVLAGFPCQGFSLGGHRKIEDSRNQLYKTAVRLVSEIRPRAVVFENVFNLQSMTFDGNISAAEEISQALKRIGYENTFGMFRCSKYGVPQTRRRFIFVGFREGIPGNYTLPGGSQEDTTCYSSLFDSAVNSLDPNSKRVLPNDEVIWGYKSRAHTSRVSHIENITDSTIFPVRLSRTASDGNPVRTFDTPMPAIDTGTIWGFAAGNVVAEKFLPDRKNRSNVRNSESKAMLWKIEADFIRKMTVRELARLQTFPDDWSFNGNTWGHCLRQIGNAVPVTFAENIAMSVKNALEHIDHGIPLRSSFIVRNRIIEPQGTLF